MSVSAINEYINCRLDELNQSCVISKYQESRAILQAAGHDTTELSEHIKATMECIARLHGVHAVACAKFKEQGVIPTADWLFPAGCPSPLLQHATCQKKMT